MAKKKKKEEKARKEALKTDGAGATTTEVVVEADGRISERVPEQTGGQEAAGRGPERVPEPERILDAWLGSGVRLKHPVNMNSAFAVGSTTGQLEATDDRGVLLRLKRDQLQFYPWGCVYAISPDDKGRVDEQ